MENAIINGVSQAGTGSAAGRFDGIIERCMAGGSGFYTAMAGAAVQLDYVKLGCRQLRKRGHRANFIALGTYSQGILDAWLQAGLVRQLASGDPGYGIFGASCQGLMIGGTVLAILDMPKLEDMVIIGDSRPMKFGPKRGRQLQNLPMGLTGDRFQSLLVGEYVLELPGPSAYLLNNVAFA
jgi:hypothetical protein